jgi:hypothetical protein
MITDATSIVVVILLGASGTLAALMVTSLENAPKPTAFLA